MKETINRCPVCSKITSIESGGIKQKEIAAVHGICWKDVGYSINGWGSRKDFLKDFSGEVCTECFAEINLKMKELQDILDKRRGSCRDEITVIRKT
jgi:hypothetical protein